MLSKQIRSFKRPNIEPTTTLTTREIIAIIVNNYTIDQLVEDFESTSAEQESISILYKDFLAEELLKENQESLKEDQLLEVLIRCTHFNFYQAWHLTNQALHSGFAPLSVYKARIGYFVYLRTHQKPKDLQKFFDHLPLQNALAKVKDEATELSIHSLINILEALFC